MTALRATRYADIGFYLFVAILLALAWLAWREEVRPPASAPTIDFPATARPVCGVPAWPLPGRFDGLADGGGE